MPLGFTGAMGSFFLRWLAHRPLVPISRANLPVLILLLMTMVGLVISPAPDMAILTIAQVVASVTIFYALFDQVSSFDDLWRLVGVILIIGVLVAFIAPFTVRWSATKLFGLPAFYEEIWPRIDKVSNPNIVAGALAPIVPLSLALIEKNDRRSRVLGALAISPLIIILILLQSRGALFALLLGVVIWIALHWKWTIPVMIIASSVTLVFLTMMGRVSAIQLLYGSESISSDTSFIQRQDMWAQALYLIRQSPLVGIGLNAYSQVGPVSFPYSPSQPGMVMPHVHNLFLQIALDTGIIGLAAFVVLLGLAIAAAWQAYRAHVERHLAIGLLSAFVVVIAHGFGDVAVWGPSKSSVILWILLGIAFAFDKVRKTV
jgi:putative inorganic carbon (HCO3(-)) transporter